MILPAVDNSRPAVLGGELPTARFCWLVHPSYKWMNTLQKSHVNHWGYNPLTSRGMSHQVDNIAMEMGDLYLVYLYNMVIFHSYVAVYQRVQDGAPKIAKLPYFSGWILWLIVDIAVDNYTTIYS